MKERGITTQSVLGINFSDFVLQQGAFEEASIYLFRGVSSKQEEVKTMTDRRNCGSF